MRAALACAAPSPQKAAEGGGLDNPFCTPRYMGYTSSSRLRRRLVQLEPDDSLPADEHVLEVAEVASSSGRSLRSTRLVSSGGSLRFRRRESCAVYASDCVPGSRSRALAAHRLLRQTPFVAVVSPPS